VQDLARLALAVSYDEPAAAARWLAGVFGFISPDPLPKGLDPLPDTGHGHPWIEVRLGDSSLVIAKAEGDDGVPSVRVGGTCPGCTFRMCRRPLAEAGCSDCRPRPQPKPGDGWWIIRAWKAAASADLRLPNILDSVTPHSKQPLQQDQNGNLIPL
jgi:hypothetical protein